MNMQGFGNFLAAQRKAKGMTQRELADRLGVTDKAISRWENGHGYPDIASLEPLAGALDVTVLELMHGRLNENDSVSTADANKAIVNAFDITISKSKNERKKTIVVFIISMLVFAATALLKSIPLLDIAAMAVMILYTFAGVWLAWQSFAAKRKSSLGDAKLFHAILLLLSALGIFLILLCASVTIMH